MKRWRIVELHPSDAFSFSTGIVGLIVEGDFEPSSEPKLAAQGYMAGPVDWSGNDSRRYFAAVRLEELDRGASDLDGGVAPMSATNRGAGRIANDNYQIVGWPGYWLTPSGIVLSCKGWRGRLTDNWRVLAQGADRDGYATVQLTVNGKSKALHIHRLMCEAFNGPRPSPAHEVRHLNGDHTDNDFRNLAWGTRLENAADREAHGRTARGEHNLGGRKLTATQVRRIKARLRNGDAQLTIARDFGVSQTTITFINTGRLWGHV